MYIEPSIESSYRINNKGARFGEAYYRPGLGKILYDYIWFTQPRDVTKELYIVEFGVRHGFSTICMAQALRDLGGGKIYAYDTWGDGRTTMERAQENINKYGVKEFIELKYGHFHQFLTGPEIERADLLHVDIGNDGDLIKKINNTLKLRPKIKCDILFEGGTKERDDCWWMQEFNRPKMRELSHTYEVLNKEYPGLSRIKNK